MKITRKKIINPQRYLYALHPGDKFYIAVQLEEDDYFQLECYGIYLGASASIPIPHRSATRANANGRWQPLKNLPKEMRSYEQPYHIVDRYGRHYEGTCWHSRMCYQREFIQPTEIAFVIENGVFYSPLFVNAESDFVNIKAAMNVALEMLGRFEVWTAERAPALPPVKQSEVPWEILPSGTNLRDKWTQHIEKIIACKSKGQQAIIRQRHEHLWHMVPDFCIVGSQNFWGYVVYGFTALNLFVFECNEVNNATYIFRGEWEEASKLTKTEILAGHIQEARVYHTDKWYENTTKLLSYFGKEVA